MLPLLILTILPLLVSSGHIYKLDFQLHHPNLSFLKYVDFSFKLDTNIIANTYFRMKFPFEVKPETSTGLITAILYNYNNCNEVFSHHAYATSDLTIQYTYYFRFPSQLLNTSFYKIKLYGEFSPNNYYNSPIELSTVSSMSSDAMVIDTNPYFADIILKPAPSSTLLASLYYSNQQNMISSINEVQFTVTPSLQVDISGIFKIAFEPNNYGYKFIGDCSCENAYCSNATCYYSANNTEFYVNIPVAIVQGNGYTLFTYIKNPDYLVTDNVNITFYLIQPNSYFIFEYFSLSGYLITSPMNLIQNTISFLVHYDIPIGDTTQKSWINYAFQRSSSSSLYMAFNSLKVNFKVNSNTSSNINTIVTITLPYSPTNVIILSGSISNNFPQNPNCIEVICRTITDQTSSISIECRNIGSLVENTNYLIGFKMFFNEKVINNIVGSIVISYMNSTGSSIPFSTPQVLPALLLKPNTEYNNASALLFKAHQHYVVSSNITTSLSDQLDSFSNKIGVFSSTSPQTLLFLITPDQVSWCTDNSAICSISQTTTNLFMYIDFSTKVDTSTASFSFQPSSYTLNTNISNKTTYQQASIRSSSGFEALYQQTQDLINQSPKGFGISGVKINFQNSLYADSYLFDFIFTLGYNILTITQSSDIIVSSFLYNSYVISPGYNINYKMSFVNFVIFKNGINSSPNEGSLFPTMVYLRLEIDDDLLLYNPTYISFFFDSTLSNYAFRDYIANSNNMNLTDYYKIGCNGLPKYQPYYCYTYDSDNYRSINSDSWVQMSRIDIYFTNNLSTGGPFNLYIPFAIQNNLQYPSYFALGLWNSSNALTMVYRLTGSNIDTDPPYNFSSLSIASNYANLTNSTPFNYFSSDPANYEILDQNSLYSNKISNITINAAFSSSTLQSNNQFNLGAGFTICSDFDFLYNASSISSPMVDPSDQCIKFTYRRWVTVVKYIIFCPFDINLASKTISLSNIIIPLNWFLNYNIPACSLVFVWSNDDGNLLSGLCGTLLINNTNKNLWVDIAIYPQNIVPYINLNIITDTAFPCPNCINIRLVFNSPIISPPSTNNCSLYDSNLNAYDCIYSVMNDNKIVNIQQFTPMNDTDGTLGILSSFNIYLVGFNFSAQGVYNYSCYLSYDTILYYIYQNESLIANVKFYSSLKQLNITSSTVSLLNKNAMSSLFISLTYPRVLLPGFILAIQLKNPLTTIPECRVFNAMDKIYSTIDTIKFINNSVIFIKFLKRTFIIQNLNIICANFKNPTTSTINFNVVLYINNVSTTPFETQSFVIQTLQAENNISSYNINKYYGYQYLPAYYQINIISTLSAILVNSTIYIQFLKKMPIKFNQKGELLCKINNITSFCWVLPDDRALHINVTKTMNLANNAILIELFQISQSDSLISQTLIFYGYSSVSHNNLLDEQAYIPENNFIANSKSLIDVVGLSVGNNALGSTTNIKIDFNIDPTGFQNNKLLIVTFPSQFDFNYSTPSYFNCTLSVLSITLPNTCYFIEKNLIINIITFNSYNQKYELTISNISLPWKFPAFYPCFDSQFIIFSVDNNANSGEVLFSIDYMIFQKITYNYCDITCKTCLNSSSNGCLSCAAPLFWNMSQCLPVCPPGFTADDKNMICRKCYYSCLKCYGETYTDCASCTTTRNLSYITSDTGTCPCIQNLHDFGRTSCEACYGSCLDCNEIYYNSCTKCYPDMILNNSVNSCGCPDGKYNVSLQTCQACNIKCKSCSPTNVSYCLTCYGNHSLTSGTCYCNTGYSDVNRLDNCYTVRTDICDITCKSCIDSNITSCVTCDNTRTLVSYNATCPCLAGYFENQQKACQPCDRTCGTCSGLLPNDCLTCLNNRIMSPLRTCNCASQFSDINTLPTCLPIKYGICYSTCTSCVGPSSTECVECITNHTLLVNQCPCDPSYYPINGTDVCIKCNFRCQTCNGPLDVNCRNCSNNHIKLQDFGDVYQCGCDSSSSDIDYLDQCQPLIDSSLCHPTCGSCIGSNNSQCASCNSSTRYFDKGYCRCKGSLFETNLQNCSDCHFTCFNCSGYQPNQCLSCVGNRGIGLNHLPKDGICVCPASYTDVLLPNCEYNQNVNNMKTAASIAMALMAASCIPLFLIGIFGLIWKLIDSAQLFSYIIFINIDFPLNFADFLIQLYNFNFNNLIPNPFQNIFSDNSDPYTKWGNIYDQTPALRFELRQKSSSFLYNAATLLLIQGGLWTFLGFLYYINKNFQFKYSITFGKIQLFLQWSLLLQMFQGGELELYLYIALQLKNPSFINIFNIFSFLIMILLFIYILLIFRESYRNLNKKIVAEKALEGNEEFFTQYGYLWENIKTERFICRNSKILSTIRKFFICFSIVFAHNYPVAQISLVMVSYILMVLYALLLRPFEFLRTNIISIITEFGLLLMHVIFLIYYNNDFSNDSKIQLGWVMISILAILLFVNLIGILIEVIINLREILAKIKELKGCIFDILPKKSNNVKIDDNINDKSKDISDLRNLKEQKGDLSGGSREEHILSPLDITPELEETPKIQSSDKNNKYNYKIIECEDMARHKTSIDEPNSSVHTRKEKKIPTIMMKNEKNEKIEENEKNDKSDKKDEKNKNFNDDNEKFISMFLNKKTKNEGTNTQKILHVGPDDEGVKLMINSNLVKKKAAGGTNFQENEDNKIKNFDKISGFDEKYDKLGNSQNQQNQKNYQQNPQNSSQNPQNYRNYQNQQNLQNPPQNLEDQRNLQNLKKSQNSQIIKNQENFGKFPNKTFFDKSAQSFEKNPVFSKPIEQSPLKIENFTKIPEIIENDNNRSPQFNKNSSSDLLESPSKKSPEILIKDLNKMIEEPPKSVKSSNFKPNLSYSKSSFGLNSMKPLFNSEITGLIEESLKKPNENIKKVLIIDKKQAETKKKNVIKQQDELVFESNDDLYNKQKPKKPENRENQQGSGLAKGFNFFLTEKNVNSSNTSITKKTSGVKKINADGVCVRDTWSKGLEFFFVTAGEKVWILESDEGFLKCQWKDKIGLFEVEDVLLEKK